MSEQHSNRRFTEEDLAENDRLHEENFLKLVDSVGKPNHKKYTDQEHFLARKEVEIKKYFAKEKSLKK